MVLTLSGPVWWGGTEGDWISCSSSSLSPVQVTRRIVNFTKGWNGGTDDV